MLGPSIESRPSGSTSFALALVLDACGEYRRAADILRQANALRLELNRGDHAYLPAEHEQFVDNLISAFDREFFARVVGSGIDTGGQCSSSVCRVRARRWSNRCWPATRKIHGAGELQLGRQSFEAVATALGRSDSPIDCVPLLEFDARSRASPSNIFERLQRFDSGRSGADRRQDARQLSVSWIAGGDVSQEPRSFIAAATCATWPSRAG